VKEPTHRFFFRHLRDGRSLHKSSLTWLAVGGSAGFLPQPLLVREVHERLSKLVDEICRGAAFVSNVDRARRLREIFDRHLIGGEHWSSLAAELSVSRRQFFRERKFLCDELCSMLEGGAQSASATILVQPSPEELRFNEAYLAQQSGDIDLAERLLGDLCASLPAGELRSKALALAADCATEGLRFDVASERCVLAAAVADSLPDFEDRVIASARVNVTRSRFLLMLSEFHRAREEIESALRGLSRLAYASDTRRTDLMQAILCGKAQLAIHVGDSSHALEHVHHLKYAAGRNPAISETSFEVASLDASTDAFTGRFQSALAKLAEALSSAQRLGFNRQVVQLAIERAWVEVMVDRSRGPLLAPKIAALAQSLHVPALMLEASLFCALNEAPAEAMEHASKARSVSPANSPWAMRAMLAQAGSCLKLGRLADAWGLATEVEKLSGLLGNKRRHAASLALMARVKLKCGDIKPATKLKNDAQELLRLYGAASERRKFAEQT
jgi:hypothetical protein